MKFNYIFNIFLFLQTILFNNVISESIFEKKPVIASQSKENSQYSITNINDGISFYMYSTGEIQPFSSEFLYYKFDNEYLFNKININWISMNSNYHIYISNDCIIKNKDFKFENISIINKTKNTQLIKNNGSITLKNNNDECKNWNKIYSETYHTNSIITLIGNFLKSIVSTSFLVLIY